MRTNFMSLAKYFACVAIDAVYTDANGKSCLSTSPQINSRKGWFEEVAVHGLLEYDESSIMRTLA